MDNGSQATEDPMNTYFVTDTPQRGKPREVHTEECKWLLYAESKTDLGEHESCEGAFAAAQQIYPGEVDGCFFCCFPCHKG